MKIKSIFLTKSVMVALLLSAITVNAEQINAISGYENLALIGTHDAGLAITSNGYDLVYQNQNNENRSGISKF